AVTHLLNGIPQFSLGGSAFIALQDPADPSSRAMARSGRCLELASLEWVDWYNNQRLFEAIRDIPPVEAEATTTAQPNHLETCRWQNQPPLDPGRFSKRPHRMRTAAEGRLLRHSGPGSGFLDVDREVAALASNEFHVGCGEAADADDAVEVSDVAGGADWAL